MRIFHSGDLTLPQILFKEWMKPAIGFGIPALLGWRYGQSVAPSGWPMLGLYCLTDTDQTILNGAGKPQWRREASRCATGGLNRFLRPFRLAFDFCGGVHGEYRRPAFIMSALCGQKGAVRTAE